MNQKLAVEKLKPLFFGNSRADRQHGILLKFDYLIAAGTNQMVMVGRAGTIEFVIFIVIAKVQLPQNPHLRHQFERTVHRRDTNVRLVLLQHEVQGFSTQMLSRRQILKKRQNFLALRRQTAPFLMEFCLERVSVVSWRRHKAWHLKRPIRSKNPIERTYSGDLPYSIDLVEHLQLAAIDQEEIYTGSDRALGVTG